MSKKGGGKNYPFCVHEFPKWNNDAMFGCTDEYRPRDQLPRGRAEAPRMVSFNKSTVELIDSEAPSDGNSSSQSYHCTHFNQDKLPLQQKIDNLYHRCLCIEHYPARDTRPSQPYLYVSKKKPTCKPTSKEPSLDQKVEKYKHMKTIIPTKYKCSSEEIKTYQKPVSQDFFQHSQCKKQAHQIPETEAMYDLRMCSSHGEPVDSGEDKCEPQKQDACRVTANKESNPYQEKCFKVCRIGRKGIFWITSNIASTHYPSKWLGATIRDFIIYLFFLLSLLTVALWTTDPTLYYYCHSINEFLLNAPYKTQETNLSERNISYYEMNSIADQWNFIKSVFIPKVYFNQIKNNGIKSSEKGMELFESVLIGVPRMRQVRVKPERCEVHPKYEKVFNVCFSYYTSLSEDVEPFGIKEDNGWKYSRDPNDRTYFGKISNYLGGGYSYIFSDKEKTSARAIDKLYDHAWINRATRAVFLDFTVYSPNINYFHIVKLTMELPPSGGVLASANCYSLRLMKYISYYDFYVLGVQLFLVGFACYYTAQTIREIIFYGHTYILLVWGAYEIVLLLISYIHILFWFCVTIICHLRSIELVDNVIRDPENFPNFNYITQLSVCLDVFSALFLIFALIKVTKFLVISKTYCYFSSTMSDCVLQLMTHIFLVIVVFLSFATLGYALFGAQVLEFSSVGWSFLSLFSWLLGSFKPRNLLESNFIMAPLFLYTFTIVMLFLFLNFFIAIVVHAYSAARCNENENMYSRLYIGEAISKCIKKLTSLTDKDLCIYSEPDTRCKENEIKCKSTECYFAYADPFVVSDSKAKTNDESLNYQPTKIGKIEEEKFDNNTGVKRDLEKAQTHDATGLKIK